MGRPIMIILSIVFGMALLSLLYMAFSGPINTMGSTIMAKSGDILSDSRVKGNGSNGGQGIRSHDPFGSDPQENTIWGDPLNPSDGGGLRGKIDTKTGNVWFNSSTAHGMTKWVINFPWRAQHIYFSTPELTRNVTDMSYMFTICGRLKTVPQMDTRNVTDMSGMFNGCSSLKSVPPMDTSKVNNMYAMFSGCSSLDESKIPSSITSNLNYKNAFE